MYIEVDLKANHEASNEPGKGAAKLADTNTETGRDPLGQLFNLQDDLGETKNLAAENAATSQEMAALLTKIRDDGRSRP